MEGEAQQVEPECTRQQSGLKTWLARELKSTRRTLMSESADDFLCFAEPDHLKISLTELVLR